MENNELNELNIVINDWKNLNKNKDLKIWIKYFAKNNISLSADYFLMTVLMAWTFSALFFINPTPLMIWIWVLMTIWFFYLYKQKNKRIITSVSVYKYSVIFMEILFKSFILKKDFFTQLKKKYKDVIKS
jgi:hypothetical protein